MQLQSFINQEMKFKVTTGFCTHCNQSEGHIDSAHAQRQVFGLVKLGLEHFGGIIDDLKEKSVDFLELSGSLGRLSIFLGTRVLS